MGISRMNGRTGGRTGQCLRRSSGQGRGYQGVTGRGVTGLKSIGRQNRPRRGDGVAGDRQAAAMLVTIMDHPNNPHYRKECHNSANLYGKGAPLWKGRPGYLEADARRQRLTSKPGIDRAGAMDCAKAK